MSLPDDSTDAESISLFEPGSDEVPVVGIVTKVAEETGQSPLEMKPIADMIDTDALQTLVDSHDRRASSVTISFRYCGQQITVTEGDIQMEEADVAAE